MSRILGFIPVRMASSRFPGKPLAEINGKAMLGHVFERAAQFEGWDALSVAVCDAEIEQFCHANGYPVIQTRNDHVRALDRVAEAAARSGAGIDDIVVCVQGDEPMLTPGLIAHVVAPVMRGHEAAVLSVPIDGDEIGDPDFVKIVTNENNEVVYTSRSPVPYRAVFPHRIGGLFAFRGDVLDWYTKTGETPLEIQESCDLNRFIDCGRPVLAREISRRPYVSVDRPEDIARVEAVLCRTA